MPDFNGSDTYQRGDDDFDLPRFAMHEARPNPYGSTSNTLGTSVHPYSNSVAYSNPSQTHPSSSSSRQAQNQPRLSQIMDSEMLSGAVNLARSASLGGRQRLSGQPQDDVERAYSDASVSRPQQHQTANSFYPASVAYGVGASPTVDSNVQLNESQAYTPRRSLTHIGPPHSGIPFFTCYRALVDTRRHAICHWRSQLS